MLEESSKRLLNYFEHGQAEYEVFRQGRFGKTEKKLADTVKCISLSRFSSQIKEQKKAKISVKKLKKMTANLLTKDFDIAKSCGFEMKELLKYDIMEENILFDGEEMEKSNKAENLQEV